MKNKWVDTKTAFAAPERPPVIGSTNWSETPEEVVEGEGYVSEMPPADPASSEMPSMTADSDGLVADPAGVAPRPTLPAGGETPRTAQELGDALRNMGRDPETGAQVQRSPLAAEAPKPPLP